MNTAKKGWTTRFEGNALRRSDFPPEHYYDESVVPDPLAAAWDEPGYVDPDLSHGNLELGAHYWQGYSAPRSTPPLRGERAMSPEWVTQVTEGQAQQISDDWEFRSRHETETERLSREPSTFFPG
ncbi:MAG: hypothetical protein ACXVB9_07590 [Bdellovibrionota bacterium]